jgi:hypothetical protein
MKKFVLGGSRAYPNRSGPRHPGYLIRWRSKYQALYGGRWHNINAVAFYD